MSINRTVALIIAGAAVAAAAALAVPAWRHYHEQPPPPPLALRASLSPFDDLTLGAGPDHPFGLALAPDGRRLAIPASREGASHIWLRDVTTGETRSLPGTDDGVLPFWSPDGSQLGFFAGGRLKTLALATGHVSDIADTPAPRGAVWHPNGNIIFAPANEGGLSAWHADGSGVRAVTAVDTAKSEISHRFPALLTRPEPNAPAEVVFFVQAREPAQAGLWTAGGTRLAAAESSAITSGAWLLYARGDALLAHRVEWSDDGGGRPSAPGRAELLGTAVGRSALGQLSATVGGDALIYGSPQTPLRDLRWIERRDATASTFVPQVQVTDVRVAPQGGRVAVTQLDPQLSTLDIWTYEGGRLLPQRVSQALDVDEMPIWSRDAARIAWVEGRRSLVSRGAMAQLPQQTLRKFDAPIRLWDWSPDGRTFVLGQTRTSTRDDLLLVPATGEADPEPYAQGPFNETQAAISPDGQWMLYASDESGQPEIYVDSFPKPGRRTRLTSGGGNEPRWNPAGRTVAGATLETAEFFYRRGSEVHAVSISFAAAVPEGVASARLFDAGGAIRSYDVAPDGDRFLVNVPAPGAPAPPLALIVNWRSLLPGSLPR